MRELRTDCNAREGPPRSAVTVETPAFLRRNREPLPHPEPEEFDGYTVEDVPFDDDGPIDPGPEYAPVTRRTELHGREWVDVPVSAPHKRATTQPTRTVRQHARRRAPRSASCRAAATATASASESPAQTGDDDPDPPAPALAPQLERNPFLTATEGEVRRGV